MFKTIQPSILYFGTPVVLISTLNEDSSLNIAPMSSIWWLGQSAMIGLDATSKTVENLLRTSECVLNLASGDIVDMVDKIAMTTGCPKIPIHKKGLGYKFIKDKVKRGGFTTLKSSQVLPERIKQCPIQLEAKLIKVHSFAKSDLKMAVPAVAIELQILQVHAENNILMGEQKQFVNPDLWSPLIMSFRKFYTTNEYIHPSKLSRGSEDAYAPWKQKGIIGSLKQLILKLAYKNFKLKQQGKHEK